MEDEVSHSPAPSRTSHEHCMEPLVGTLEVNDAQVLWSSPRRSFGYRPVARPALLVTAMAALVGICFYAFLGRPASSLHGVRGVSGSGRHSGHDTHGIIDFVQAISAHRSLSYQADNQAEQSARDEVIALHAEIAHLQIMLPKKERLAEIADLRAHVLLLKSTLLKKQQRDQFARDTASTAQEDEDGQDAEVLEAPVARTATVVERSRKPVAAGASGWYDGGEDQSCDAGCAALNLRCSERAFDSENDDVAGSDKVLSLIKSVGGLISADSCSDEFGASPDVPLWSKSFCFHSKASRGMSSFDCSTVPMPLGEGKHRLCFCEEDSDRTAAIERDDARQCALANQNCSEARCCREEGQVCFEKAPGWAACAYECMPGIHIRDPVKYRSPWSCTILSPPETPKYPTLFCFLAMQSSGLELHVVQQQVKDKAGIFSCSDYKVFSDKELLLGSDVKTMKLEQFAARSAVKGALTATWVNTDAFTEAWEAVMSDSRAWNHDWVVKVDPDTVFFPARLQVRLRDLASKTEEEGKGNGAYLRNCNTDALQLYGSLEVISREALQRLRHRGIMCDGADNKRMGEDMWIQRCLDRIGVAGIDAWDVLEDSYCPATNKGPQQPCKFGAAAFHPYKATQQWSDCWDIARFPRPHVAEVVKQ